MFAQNDEATKNAFVEGGNAFTAVDNTDNVTESEVTGKLATTVGMLGWKDASTKMDIRVVNRYDSATVMYADEAARQVGNWVVSEDGSIAWSKAE